MIVNRCIIHVLDKNSDIPVLNDVENEVVPEIKKFYEKTIRRVLRDDDLRKAVFEDYQENPIKVCTDHILYDEDSFVLSSRAIATRYFETMNTNSDLDSCDLAIVSYVHKDEKGVAIIKLDYKKLYTHKIDYDDTNSKVSVQMVSNDIGIQDSQRIVHAALVGLNGANDEWHLQVLDKKAEKVEDDSSFVTEFLKVKKIKDEKYLTKTFRKDTDEWITNAYSDDVQGAELLRASMNKSLLEDDEIDIKKFVEDNIDEEKQESYRELLEEREIQESLPVDKAWVEKKLKQRKIKTDTGFEIKAPLDNFSDQLKYSIKKNEDGTFNLIVKNVKFYEEK